MGEWFLRCPKGGEYKCQGKYEGGHGEPFSLHCDKIETIRAPKGGACVDAPVMGNPRTRAYLPHSLTEEEKANPAGRKKLSHCIKATEKRCCGKNTLEYDKCKCNPVAVCRTSLKHLFKGDTLNGYIEATRVKQL